MTTVFELPPTSFINSLNSKKMNRLSINSLLILAFAFTSLSASAQYLSMRDDRPKIDKTNKNLFQVAVNQEVVNNLAFKILINNPGLELLNVTLKDKDGKLFQDDIFYRRPNYSLNLNLSRLEDGIYTLSITTNYESYKKIFTLTTEELGTRNGQMYLDRKVEISQDEKAR
jgi:hypothetical protein